MFSVLGKRPKLISRQKYQQELRFSFSYSFSEGLYHHHQEDCSSFLTPQASEDNYTWYRGSITGTRSGHTIDLQGTFFEETNAFVDGLVPYGDIP